MGIAASIAGPTLNILIGIGLGSLLSAINSGGIADLPNSDNIVFMCFGLMFGLIIYSIFVILNGFVLKKWLGYWNLLYYVLFLVFNVLVYTKIIDLKID